MITTPHSEHHHRTRNISLYCNSASWLHAAEPFLKMAADDHQQQELLERRKEIEAKRQNYQNQVKVLHELSVARARTRQRRSVSQDIPENLDTAREVSTSQESHDYSSNSGQDSFHDPASDITPSVGTPSIAGDPGAPPAVPSEETLKRFATTVAYSSYSRLCGTSDRSLVYQLFENDLQKEPSNVLDPKKMVEVPRTGHKIACLREEIAEGASLFATRMIEARRRVDPEVTTDDQVRRLGPANFPGDSLPVYWIVTFGQQGVVDWEEGCSLARAYRRVFEDFGAEDVHCLVFESEHSVSGVDGQKAYAME